MLTYRRNQLKQELLVGELQHRLRNLFSTIGAVVYATLKSHPEPTTFRKTFDGRLMALARAHSLALESGETDLRQLLVEILAPYSIDGFVSIEGPKLILTQEAAVAFSLAAHELATNAVKYGAFSRDGGSVKIEWDFENDTYGGPQFELTVAGKGRPRGAATGPPRLWAEDTAPKLGVGHRCKRGAQLPAERPGMPHYGRRIPRGLASA